MVRRIKSEWDVQVIAGNVATAEGTESLIDAGADAVKVGQGPGASCPTRVVAGVGVPQVTAIYECGLVSRVSIIGCGGLSLLGWVGMAVAARGYTVMTWSIVGGAVDDW